MKIALSGPLNQSEITTYWPEIERTIENALCSELGMVDTQITVAMTQTAIRTEETWVLAVWKDDLISGFMLMKPHRERGHKPSLLLHALWSAGGIQDDEWVEVCRQLEQIAMGAGYSRLTAQTANPRMHYLADKLGWKQRWSCSKDLTAVSPDMPEEEPVE